MIIKNNNNLKIKFRKMHPDAVIPTYAKQGDAAMDLYAAESMKDKWGNHVYLTGVALEIPPGFVGLLFPRSSVSKTSLSYCRKKSLCEKKGHPVLSERVSCVYVST